jgi:hypothetical protein
MARSHGRRLFAPAGEKRSGETMSASACSCASELNTVSISSSSCAFSRGSRTRFARRKPAAEMRRGVPRPKPGV